MECRMYLDLIMKYLDGEITCHDEKLLHEHLAVCKNCRFEFAALKQTFSMLEDVEMEDPPENFEQAVLVRIRKENASKSRFKALRVMSLAALAVFMVVAWIMCLLDFTNVVSIILNNFNRFTLISKTIIGFAAKILHNDLVAGAKLFAVLKALIVVQKEIIEIYGVLIIAAILLIMIISKLYSHIFKFMRR